MMAKRRRRKPYAQRNTAPAKPVEAAEEKTSAADGFINTLAYLGEASPLSKANDYERHTISTDLELLTVLYRENWLAARIIDTPCEDMTRAWYTLSSEIDQEKLDEIAKLEAKHNVKQEITNGIRWGRLYGGAAAVMVIKGQEDMLDQPLDYDTLLPGCFRGLIVVDKVRGIFPSIELEEDMDDVEFGYPKYYEVTLDEETGSIVRIHHSRLLLFKGRQLPIDEEIGFDYWGASELEHVYEELQKRNASSANIAQLIFQANVAGIMMADYGEVLGMASSKNKEQVYRAIQEMNRLKTSFGIMLMGKDDRYEQHPYSFAGVAEVYETFMMDMAGAAEIPATKLFGRAPQGMNATGESDMKNYYEMVGQLQERILRPALEKLVPVMCMSEWGEIPDDLEIVFESLGTTTPSERAEIMERSANPVVSAYQAGLISQQTALKELRELGKPIGAWTNISDEDIENAETEPDMGEEMQDPMGMMGGQLPPEMGGGQAPPEDPTQAQLENVPAPEAIPQEGLETQEVDSSDRESRIAKIHERIDRLKRNAAREDALKRLEEIRQIVRELEEKQIQEDGGPGSGPRPGYHKNGTSLIERAKFMANPTAGMQQPRYTGPNRSAAAVEKANREREAWSQLGIGQKVRGTAEENRHIRHVKKQVAKLAAKGDIEGAKRIVQKNRHYWANDPNSAMKVQSETLKRQQGVKKGFIHDLLAFLRKPMEEDGGPGSGNHNHAGRPGLIGGSAPAGSGGVGSEESAKAHNEIREKALKAFGTTENKARAGYLLPDGQMLDFGRNGFGAGKDHRAIEEVYDGKKKGFEAMADFISGGNIRMIADAPGITIAQGVPITEAQQKILAEFIDGTGYDQNWFYVDVFNPEGKVVGSDRFRLNGRNDSDDILPQIVKASSENPVDIDPLPAYNGSGKSVKGWKSLNAKLEVGGPKGAKEFIRDYFNEHPDVARQATKFMDVRRKVMNFLQDHPEAENFNTYDAKTGEAKDIDSGYCVTFHQNNTPEDPLGGYTDEEYAGLCAIAAHELGTDEVNIGYFGNPEVSFVCKDEGAAKRFAVAHNQHSVYNASTHRTLKNRQYNEALNPIRL